VTDIQILPMELSTFRFPDPELAGRRGVVMGYAVRHPGGVLVFDTGFGFGNAELDQTYQPISRRVEDAIKEVGVTRDEVTDVVNCHLHADHAGQNGALPDVPIHVQPAEWELAHTSDHTILDWIEAPGTTYRQTAGDHELAPGIRVVATPGHTAGHQSLVVETEAGPVVLAGQACYSVGEWDGDPDALDGRGGAHDQAAYDRSIEKLRAIGPVRVHFGHDRQVWLADRGAATTPAILPGPC
jgi:glyoxylase-like metal-dependent hydrolase (beta-lactamase superfamily II)